MDAREAMDQRTAASAMAERKERIMAEMGKSKAGGMEPPAVVFRPQRQRLAFLQSRSRPAR